MPLHDQPIRSYIYPDPGKSIGIGRNAYHIIYHTVYPLSMENASFSRKIQRCISNTTSKMHDILPFVFNNRLSLSSIP